MDITIYTASGCPFCQMAKDYLQDKGVGYEEKSIDENEDLAEEIFSKTDYAGTPVIDIDGNLIVGYDEQRIDEALSKAEV